MSGELELSKVQESGEIVVRREDNNEDNGLTPFLMLTSGFAAGTVAALLSQDLMAFSAVMGGSVLLSGVFEGWKRRHQPKITDVDHYSVLQMESLTKNKAPATLYKEIKVMRASLVQGERLVLDPFTMMALPRPENNTTWATLTKTGLNFYPKKPEISEAQWDEEFSLSEKSETPQLPEAVEHRNTEES